MLLELARAVKPEGFDKVRVDDAEAIRAEIARAVPSYAGIEKLSRQGDQFQWGGPMLCAGRKFPTSDGKAHFAAVVPSRAELERNDVRQDAGAMRFVLATRRGKQFNSMVQADVDTLTGASRDHVLIARTDADKLGLRHDQRIVLRNTLGEFRGRAFVAEVAEGTLQGHWPEVNGLIAHGRVDAAGGVPDYNAEVTVEPA